MERGRIKLTSIRLRNFCCFADSGEIPIHDMTIFIGENDCGKTSILKAIGVFYKIVPMGPENFCKVNDVCQTACEIELTFTLEVGDVADEYKQYIINDELKIKRAFTNTEEGITDEYIARQQRFEQEQLNQVNILKMADLKALCTSFNLTYESVDQAKQELTKYLSQNFSTLPKTTSYSKVDWTKIAPLIPSFEIYDSSNYGRPQDLVAKTLMEVYRGYFYELADGAEKLKPTFATNQQEIRDNLNRKIEENLKTKIQGINKKVRKVTGRFSIDFGRGFQLETLLIDFGHGENPLNNIGEGSKKRLFLAINEWDKEIRLGQATKKRIIRGYDEPDASLHYSAQKEMFYSLKARSEDPNDKLQVVICTHSIAMVDRAPAAIINYTEQNSIGLSSVSYLKGNEDSEVKEFLDSISEISGIKNSSLFFERCFLIVEGDSEDNFLPKAYQKTTGHTLSEDGIVLINLRGNSAWQPFLKLLSKNKANATVLMLDTDVQNDRSRKVTPGKLTEIGFQGTFLTTNTFLIGTKEFEDVFSDEVICRCLNKYWKKDANKQWTVAEISALRTQQKFSEALENFVNNYRTNNPVTFESFGKAEFGRKMAEEITVNEFSAIPPFRSMIEKLKAITA
jgi:predicted ATP-dependent endonuclease of OLD family